MSRSSPLAPTRCVKRLGREEDIRIESVADGIVSGDVLRAFSVEVDQDPDELSEEEVNTMMSSALGLSRIGAEVAISVDSVEAAE